ncbi:MAG: quinolinate synthase NadA [Planctomycetota bacterium]
MQLWQPSLPERYLKASPDSLAVAIADRRRRLGDRLVILGHHYQVDEVVRHADLTGDSLKLSQLAAGLRDDPSRTQAPEFVVFCGVHFMAETADMLTDDSTAVILPDLSAGCSMADMADYDDTVDAWELLHESLNRSHGGSWNGRIVPITYVNSTAAIKSFVGAHGGACCTSSNADKVFAWAMDGGTQARGDGEEIKILFLPDQHLGRNTAHNYGVDVAQHAALYDPKRTMQGQPLGGMTERQLADASVVLWAGHCSVHKLFRPEHIDEIRADDAEHPDRAATTVIVHPECSKEVVDKADQWGSTEKIIKTIEAAEPGSRWAVGTEVHLVGRLAQAAAARGVDVRILSDCQCLCTTMYRIDEPHLLWVLDRLLGIKPEDDPDAPTGTPTVVNRVAVHPEVRGAAVDALDRMLGLVSAPA